MLLLFAAAVAAQDPLCRSIQTNDLINCAANELRHAEGELGKQLKRARAKVAQGDRAWKPYDPIDVRALNGGITYRQALDRSQNAWLAYREAQCKLATYGNAGGRELHIYQLGCRTLLTNERVKQLKQFNEDQ
jgi:uncharacterized protein YecT (DUF1311 family)